MDFMKITGRLDLFRPPACDLVDIVPVGVSV